MKNITINTYQDTFLVSETWLLANTDFQTTEEFLSNYTWDEGEWLYILYKTKKEDEEIAFLIEKIKQDQALFKRGNKEGILHGSSRGTGYQFSYFDQHGPIGDFQIETLEEAAKKIYEYGFQPCHSKNMEIII